MPIVTKRFGKNRNEPDDFENMPDTAPDNMEIKDFSDDIDVDALGSLLSGGTPNIQNSDFNMNFEQMPESKKSSNIAENIGKFVRSIADKIGGKNPHGDIPDLPDSAERPVDPNYVSETVSFTDYPNPQQGEQFGTDDSASSISEYSQQNFGGSGMDNDDFGFDSEPRSDFRSDENMYMPQEQQEMTYSGQDYTNKFDAYTQPSADFGQGAPQYQPYGSDAMNSAPQYQPYNSNAMNSAPQYPPYGSDAMNSVPQYQPYDSGMQSADDVYTSFEQTSENSEDMPPAYDEEQPVHRPHDIMGAVKARIEQFRRRLPSFKPKEYSVPEPSYKENYDDSIRSPSLVADIEKIIRKQSDLGDVSREYEEMRQYIHSVDENAARLPRYQITPPENIHEVYSAQNELFDMIYQIGAENEQQRSRIGVYERPQEEDPYNYRGINDERQNYTDVEADSFSMSPSMDFESENKVSFERMMWERQQHQAQSVEDLSTDDGFDSDFDDDFFDMEQNEHGQEFTPDFTQGSYGGQVEDDGFDDDLILDDDTLIDDYMPPDDRFADTAAPNESEKRGLFGIKVKPRRR